MNRKRVRTRLREVFGDYCYWCGLKMDFPRYGEIDPYHENMATIEHHIAKKKNKGNEIYYLRLAHKKCNI